MQLFDAVWSELLKALLNELQGKMTPCCLMDSYRLYTATCCLPHCGRCNDGGSRLLCIVGIYVTLQKTPSWSPPSEDQISHNLWLEVKAQVMADMLIQAQRGSKGITFLIHNLGARWGWVVNATSRPLDPRKEPWYPLYCRLGGPQNRSARVWRS